MARATPTSRDSEPSLRHAIRVVVVKWDRFSAEAIRREVHELFQAQVELCHDAASALVSLRAQPADLGIFGLTLPDMDGLDLVAAVVEERLADRRLIVSWRRDERARVALRHMGVHGWFESEHGGLDALSNALKAVVDGRYHFRKDNDSQPVPSTRETPLDRLLSETEFEVFAVLGDGSDDLSAADRLGLSAKTVHTHRQRIMRKLGVQTRADLMRVAMQRGVVRFCDDRVLRPGLERALAQRSARARGANKSSRESSR